MQPLDKKLYAEASDRPLRLFKDDIEEGVLITDPDYQRRYVYSDAQASKLIESVLMSIPLPTVYLCEENGGKCSIIDGQQRIVSFTRFLSNRFCLCKLDVYPNFNGCFFKDLDSATQQHIKSYTLRTILIKQESSDMKYDIFERLNQGAVNLKPQELRNCIYRGPLNDLIKDLATNKNFLSLYGQKDQRMGAEEFVLRFFALRDYQSYKGSAMKSMNKFMEIHQNASPKEIDDYRMMFSKTMDCIKQVLGENAFWGADEKTRQIMKKFRGPIFDSIAIPFSFFPKEKLILHADEIREQIFILKTTAGPYNDEYCNGASGSRERVWGRIKSIENLLAKILGDNAVAQEKRTFDESVRRALFSSDPTCALCGQKILSIEDSQVDHIVPYSKGGSTTLDNAQLVHRFCNEHKSDHYWLDDDGESLDSFSGHLLFFNQTIQHEIALSKVFPIPKAAVIPSSNFYIPLGKSGLCIDITIYAEKQQVAVCFYVANNTSVWRVLSENKDRISNSVGFPTVWSLSEKNIGRISHYFDGFDIYTPNTFKAFADMALQYGQKLRDVVLPIALGANRDGQ